MLILLMQAITVLSLLFLAVFVFLKGQKAPAHIFFALSCAVIGVWAGIGAVWNYQIHIGILPALASRLGVATASFGTASLLAFSWYFPTRAPQFRSWHLAAVFAWALLMAGGAFTPWSVSAFRLSGTTFERTFGPLYYVFGFSNSLVFLAIVFNLGLSYRHLRPGLERQKVTHLFFGLAVTILFVFISMFLLPSFGIHEVFFLGNLAPLFLAAFTAYAIIRYRALDISTVMHKTAVWGFSALLILVGVYLGLHTGRAWLSHHDDFTLTIVVGTTIFLVYLYYRLVQPRLDNFFQRKRYALSEVLDGFSGELSVLKTLEELDGVVRRTLEGILYASHADLLLRDPASRFVFVQTAPASYRWEEHLAFFAWLETWDDILDVEEVRLSPAFPEESRQTALAYFNALDSVLCLPLFYNQSLIGVVNLGRKANLREYQAVDYQLLSILRHDLGIALSNSRLFEKVNSLYRELKEFNDTLAQRISERTADLETAMEKLQKIDQLKTDFISMVSHELRTPITSVKGALALAREQMAAGRREGPELSRLLSIGEKNIDRLIHLINDLLDLAKLEEANLPLQLRPMAMGSVLQAALDELQPLFTGKNLQLDRQFSGDFWVRGDADRLLQVVINLLGNAIKFSPAGGTIRLRLAGRADMVECSVEDEGPGIASENREKIFNKFNQARTLTQNFFESTGLGLSIAKKIIELHEGRIWVESRVGEGSSFKFLLPAASPAPPAAAPGG
jgi:signal transduction histidine kinase